LLLGVHIRRGDYRTWSGGQYFYDDEVYLQKLREAAALFPNRSLQIVLSSNEPVNLGLYRKAFPQTRLAIGLMAEDLLLLSKCDYLIGPPSTYSCWASYYGRVPLLFLRRPDQPVRKEDFLVRPRF
jgi:hypothetical protein